MSRVIGMRAAGPDWVHAFDLLELDGENFRSLPLSDRKKRLARLWAGAGSALSC
jgi:ATP-dependent DNA ligase